MVYKTQQEMENKNKNCWLRCINRLAAKCNEGKPPGKDFHKNTLRTRYEDTWFRKLWEKKKDKTGKQKVAGKLTTYRKFKKHFEMESYLLFPSRKYRIQATRLRISAHQLQVEIGRHTKPKTPKEDRLCTRCKDNKVEDEIHLFQCPSYKEQRQTTEIPEKCTREQAITLIQQCYPLTTIYIGRCFESKGVP